MLRLFRFRVHTNLLSQAQCCLRSQRMADVYMPMTIFKMEVWMICVVIFSDFSAFLTKLN